MWVKHAELLIAAVAAVLVAACATPRTKPEAIAEWGHGLSLSAGEAVLIHLTTRPRPKPADADGNTERLPIADPESVLAAFLEGFRSVRSDVKIVPADAAITAACFGDQTSDAPSTSHLYPALVVHVLAPTPRLTDPECRHLIEQEAVRYFVSVEGERETISTWEVIPFGIAKDHRHRWEVDARVFDPAGASSVCYANRSAADKSGAGVAAASPFIAPPLSFLIIPPAPLPIPVPLPLFRLLDDAGYWKALARQTGAATAECFLPRRTARSPDRRDGRLLACVSSIATLVSARYRDRIAVS